MRTEERVRQAEERARREAEDRARREEEERVRQVAKFRNDAVLYTPLTLALTAGAFFLLRRRSKVTCLSD